MRQIYNYLVGVDILRAFFYALTKSLFVTIDNCLLFALKEYS